ncbi:CD99 antigen isoform X2 [Sagmatias obliquidens]|uniref:CD99 antigen isoform X2 n=1 Tax=Sagmatias obliquidens TaxID=3371155 RepID=UPI000F4431BB|nr:CD99 antigen isoform X2 [Lagenorhynchus obliquidens]
MQTQPRNRCRAPQFSQELDDNFNLEDALGGGSNDPVTPEAPKPKPNPNPKQPGSSDGFSDSDLTDGTSDGGGGDGGNQRPGGAEQADSPGVVPGIIGAVAVAVAGAISSFIAYQKKKLCFRENADQGEMNMENHQGTNAEPPESSQPGGELDQEQEVVQIMETSQGQSSTDPSGEIGGRQPSES